MMCTINKKDHINNVNKYSIINSDKCQPEYKVKAILKAKHSYNCNRNKIVITIHDKIK